MPKGPKTEGSSSADTQPPSSLAQTPPRVQRSYDEMNTGAMVFELQGTVGEIKHAVATLEKTLDKGLAALEKKIDEHQKSLRWIEKIVWIVTGGSIVIGSLIGLVTGVGLQNILIFINKFH